MVSDPNIWLKLLGDEQTIRILSSMERDTVSIQEISERTDIAAAACYRKIESLMAIGAIIQDERKIKTGGKPSRLFRSTLKRLDILFGEGGMFVEIESMDGSIRSLHLDILTDSVLSSKGRIIYRDEEGSDNKMVDPSSSKQCLTT